MGRLIDASVLRREFRKGGSGTFTLNGAQIAHIRRIIDLAPTVALKTGKWKYIGTGTVEKAKCSVCSKITITEPFGEPPFCQWCGSKMKGSG